MEYLSEDKLFTVAMGSEIWKMDSEYMDSRHARDANKFIKRSDELLAREKVKIDKDFKKKIKSIDGEIAALTATAGKLKSEKERFRLAAREGCDSTDSATIPEWLSTSSHTCFPRDFSVSAPDLWRPWYTESSVEGNLEENVIHAFPSSEEIASGIEESSRRAIMRSSSMPDLSFPDSVTSTPNSPPEQHPFRSEALSASSSPEWNSRASSQNWPVPVYHDEVTTRCDFCHSPGDLPGEAAFDNLLLSPRTQTIVSASADPQAEEDECILGVLKLYFEDSAIYNFDRENKHIDEEEIELEMLGSEDEVEGAVASTCDEYDKEVDEEMWQVEEGTVIPETLAEKFEKLRGCRYLRRPGETVNPMGDTDLFAD